MENWLEMAQDVRGVVFDFGGVISYPPGENWPAYDVAAALGLSRAAFDKGFRDYRHLWDGGFIDGVEMYRRIFADAGRTATAADLAALWEVDATAWIRDLRPETLDLMRRLKADGRKLGILTNMSPDFYERLFVPRAAAYRALVDAEVVSGLEHLYKPQRAIYDLMAQRLALPPERLLFFDDTPANVEAARACGWQAEVYPR